MKKIKPCSIWQKSRGKLYHYLQYKYLINEMKAIEEGHPTVIALSFSETVKLMIVLGRFLELEDAPEDLKKFAQELLDLLRFGHVQNP